MAEPAPAATAAPETKQSVTTQKQLPAGPPKAITGESAPGPTSQPKPATAAEPDPKGKQPQGKEPAAPAPAEEETFYDPKDLPDELKVVHKQMQRSFTKKMEAIKGSRQKISAYDEFMRDPVGSMQRLAQQNGYQLSRVGEQPQQAQQPFQPKTWEEVIAHVSQEAEAKAVEKLRGEIAPYLGTIKQTRQTQIESALDEHVPEWRQYEDDMMSLLANHPTLANDPVALAKLAIPDDVQRGKAMQAAMKKLQDKAQAAQVLTGSSTSRSTGEKPNGKMSFNEAVEHAKRRLASQGIRPG